MAVGAEGAGRREECMKRPAPVADPSKPRLTTSAMIASIAGEGQKTKSAPFGHALVALARSRNDIVGMTADLGKYTDLHIFAKEYPDRSLPNGYGRAAFVRRRFGLGGGGVHAIRDDVRRIRLAPRLRFHSSDDRRGRPQRKNRLRSAWASRRGMGRAIKRRRIWHCSAQCRT